jgi:Cu(I)/Ag(I) efflux system membrane fusion protein
LGSCSEEFLALKRSGDADLLAAARQRLRLTGMPATLIAQVERSGKVQPNLTLTSPIGGVLQELSVREGMTVAAGETLARVNGLSSVWLAVAVPESEAGSIVVGQAAEARLPRSLELCSRASSARFFRKPIRTAAHFAFESSYPIRMADSGRV